VDEVASLDRESYFKRIKFFQCLSLALFFLAVSGIALSLGLFQKLIPGAVLCFSVLFVSYIKTCGLYVLSITGQGSALKYSALDACISLFLELVLGLKLVSVYGFSIWAAVVYIIVWCVYCIGAASVFKNNHRGRKAGQDK
jgi:hypothetical protein